MKNTLASLILVVIFMGMGLTAFAQENEEKEIFSESTFSGLKFRSIGPAFMSGRIADIAIHPDDNSIWYVAVGSGNVWKTTNAGTTWKPIFDNQPSYSIGCLAIDPNNPHVVWVGTGENVGGRHVGYGDGIYKSEDGGSSWTNMGLKETQHISKIIIHPKNSDVIWVAAQGPLWNKGEERGLYKSTDGGKTWYKTLGDDEWVGVTDIVIDPRNPDRIYAATWQRHRNVAAYMGGGPGTGLHRSTDGGETWEQLKNGLPTSNMGKIGLAISPQNPDVVYAAIELDRRTGGVYRSSDRGSSWKRMSDAVAGATGPHYYQELYACPHNFDKIYLVDVRIQVSEDGGKTFERMKEVMKHSDNHAMAFRCDDPDYLLIGTDGGVYETFDGTENWRFVTNLPLTQYYKVAVDDAEPFYNIYGGTQDNGTHGGPSRTVYGQGITNEQWRLILWADGHQPATEPGNPNIVYAESQEGGLHRIDMTTGERFFIQPQPEEGEPYGRFNWDSPILVSPHSPSRLYFASQRLWRSDNRGDSWIAVSPDLTRNQERIALPIMENTWSWDSPWDFYAMSNYNSITSIAESPIEEGLLYVGTDDGIIQVSEDGGDNWRKIEVGELPDVPETAFVNDIKADLFDENTVYVALDNHKFGDLDPYLLKSTDRGESWKSMKGNVPNRTLVWRIVQDHVNKDLFFLATEFGIYFTIDAGEKWIKLTGGVPTISFRDLAIQRRENDLVGASFGRSFYVLDDYSMLREVTEEQLEQEAALYLVRDAWRYTPKLGKGSQGAAFYVAENPPFGAVFTYYLKDGFKTKETVRQKEEKELIKEGEGIEFPGWDAVEAERREQKPTIWLTVSDSDGNVVRRVQGPTGKGIHRVAWDLRYPSTRAVGDDENRDYGSGPSGIMAPPGAYSVSLSSEVDGKVMELAGPVSFNVKQLWDGSLEGSSYEEAFAYGQELMEFSKETSAVSTKIRNALKRVEAMQTALYRSAGEPGDLDEQLHQIRMDLLGMEEQLFGNKSKDIVGEKNNPTIYSRLGVAFRGVSNSTYGPTPTHRRNLEIAQKEFEEIIPQLDEILDERMPELEKALQDAGAPYIEGGK